MINVRGERKSLIIQPIKKLIFCVNEIHLMKGISLIFFIFHLVEKNRSTPKEKLLFQFNFIFLDQFKSVLT